MKKLYNYVCLLNKLKQFFFFFKFLDFSNIFIYFDILDLTTLNQEDGNNNGEKKSMLITIIQVTYPLRQALYGVSAIIIINTFFGVVDSETVWTIFTVVDVIDRSIVQVLNEIDEDAALKSNEDKKKESEE